MRGKKDWINTAIKHKGGLHKALNVPQGKKIPETKLERAEHSKNSLIKKEANLAQTLEGFHK
jgi:hypothetical protein